MIDRNNHYEGFSTTENMTAEKIADFIDRLSMRIRRNTFVVLDNASVHRCKFMKELRPIWEKRGLFLFFLPPYSPHLNIAETPFVRHALVAQQQAMGKNKGIVMDGRDIGTTVFPDAEMKVYVDASAETRAQRRFDELRSKGDTTTTYEQVLENVKHRDLIDTTRAESPLRRAHDAIVLDNSHMSRDEQNQWLLDLYNKIAGE